jgi:hypothetical protein
MAAIKIRNMITGEFGVLPTVKGDKGEPGWSLPDGFEVINKPFGSLTTAEKDYLLKTLCEMLGLIEVQ